MSVTPLRSSLVLRGLCPVHLRAGVCLVLANRPVVVQLVVVVRRNAGMATTSVGPYMLGKTLGSGSTGKVKLATHRDTHAQVAVKIIKKELLAQKPLLKRVVSREISVMKLLSHPHVVSLFDVYDQDDRMYVRGT